MMKKSTFTAMMMGTVSSVMFALGMCMILLPEWNSFVPGVILGGLGLILLLATVLVWRKMEGKPALKPTGKNALILAVCAVSVLALGVGMCCCMVWNRLALGVVIGLAGILGLMCLIPMVKGFKA